MGCRRLARRDSLLSRHYAVRCHVRPDGAGVDIHAGRLWCYQQRGSLLGDCADAAAGHVRHVLWLPHLLGLRAGT